MAQEITLTKNQRAAFDLIEGTNRNVFITGKPGVGKSVLINYIVEEGRKHYTLAAPTGLAALNINGKTLHSLFRVPVFDSIIESSYNEFVDDGKVSNHIRYHIKHLIIDEISMVRVDLFDYLNRLLKHIKGNDDPFGGIQLIIVGDFYQLAPVADGKIKVQLHNAGYNSEFVFDSSAFKEANFEMFELNEVLRQKEPQFIKLLHKARTGDMTLPLCGLLNKNIGVVEDLRIMLCGTNPQADIVNRKHLEAIKEEPHVFKAVEYGQWPAYPVEKELILKVGAQVMVKMNGADRSRDNSSPDFISRAVNGTLATIIGFESDGTVLIEDERKQHIRIYTREWQRKIKEFINGAWEEKIVASYTQMPLSLAWAISIHKSQGQSFDRVHIDPSKIFAAGQLYVAISRARNLKGLKFSSPVNTKKFFANKDVVRFYKQLNSK